MRWSTFAPLLALASPSWAAPHPLLLGIGNNGVVASAYVGPGDIVSGATAWYGLRAYNAAYATGSNKAINVRRASDNTTQDILILSNGNLDIASANTFAGTDATASCTSSGTTMACTGASSTPHVGSTITDGGNVTQPCYATAVGTFTGGAGNVTTNGCGTVGVAQSTTFQYGLYVTEVYDQSGNALHQTQATAANQPQLFPLCSTLPCMYFSGAKSFAYSSTFTSLNQPYSTSDVATFTGSGNKDIIQFVNSTVGYGTSANHVFIFAGSARTASATDNSSHAVQSIFNGASSVISVDNTETTISPGSNTTGANSLKIGTGNDGTFLGYIWEAGVWPSAISAGNRTSMCHNQFVYWGTSTSC